MKYAGSRIFGPFSDTSDTFVPRVLYRLSYEIESNSIRMFRLLHID